MSYLTVQHISALPGVSSYWKAFCSANECTIYRNAAALHGFVPSPDITLPYANSLYPKRSMVGADNWKTFCTTVVKFRAFFLSMLTCVAVFLAGKRRFQIEKAWIGRGPSTIQIHQGTGTAVHRFKVDEDAGFIIATSDGGGLVVTDIVKNEVVWSLSPVSHYVPDYLRMISSPLANTIRSFSVTSIVMHIANMEAGSFVLIVSTGQSRSGVDVTTLALQIFLQSRALIKSNWMHLSRQLYVTDQPAATTNLDHGRCFRCRIYMRSDLSSLPCLWLP
jgi:hypothetical protein